jgi:hypothetical protein
MKYFEIQPDVAGGLGEHTVMDRSGHRPIVSRLHYEIDGWFGDSLLRTSPCYILTVDGQKALEALGATGITFDSVEVTTSGQFEDFHGDMKLPPFVWMKVDGEAGRDDFWMTEGVQLVVSERALEVLKALGVPGALIEPFDDP